jgi:hypothetical protein
MNIWLLNTVLLIGSGGLRKLIGYGTGQLSEGYQLDGRFEGEMKCVQSFALKALALSVLAVSFVIVSIGCNLDLWLVDKPLRSKLNVKEQLRGAFKF